MLLATRYVVSSTNLARRQSATACSIVRQLSASRAAVIHLARRLRIVASNFDRGNVPVIGVHTSRLTTTDDSHTLVIHVAIGATAAGAEQIAVFFDVEVLSHI